MDEQLEQLKLYLDPDKVWTESEENQLSLLLRFSASKIINRRYPFDDDITEVPAKYLNLQVRIAAELFAKMGAEGQTSHSENGINRVWDDADVAKSMLAEVVPKAKAFGVVQ